MVLQGDGELSYVFGRNTLGERIVLEVFVTDPDGRRFSAEERFTIHDLDLLWSGHTYTPPFYKGLPLVSPQSFLKVSAIPHVLRNGRVLDPSELVFTWSIDGVVLGEYSGVGKDTLVLNGNNFPQGITRVALNVSARNGSEVLAKQLEVETVSPEIILYPVHPLNGIDYTRPIGDEITLEEEEVTVHATPLYYSVDDIQVNRIDYRWKVNNESATPSEDSPSRITFRKDPEARSGSVKIGIDVENQNKVLQYIRRVFRLSI